MKIAVMGAGAVGCYYGGLLARAGHEVTLIGRAHHVEALRARGLRLQAQAFDEFVPLAASTEPAAARDADWVLLCVKATDTDGAAAALAPHLRADARLLSLQNGIDNAERLEALLPGHTVLPALVYVAAEMAGAGHVRHHGRGELVLGAEPAGAEIAAALCRAGVAVESSTDLRAALWSKLLINCAWNALSAITRQPYGRLLQGTGVEPMLRDVVAECLAVARADGVTLPADSWESVRRIALTMPTQRSSTAQDLARGHRSEIDHLNGYVVRRGEALGIPTPVNRVLHSLVRLLEDAPAADSMPG